MDDNSKLLKTIERVALEAGELLLARMGQVEIHEKQARDLVTAADLESQELIRSRLEVAFPGFGFLGEEQSHETDWKQGKCWIVDPIDGTMNFAHQMPGFSVSVGLFSEGQPVAGVVYDPVLREVF